MARASKVNRKKRRCGAIGGGRGWQPEQVTGEKEGATTNDGVIGRVGNKAKEEKGCVVVVAATIGTTNCVSRRNNTKLFNYKSDFRRNSAFKLKGYSKNSVNNDNINKTSAVDN